MSILLFSALIGNLLFSGSRLTYHSLITSWIYYELCETEVCALTQGYS